MDIQTNAAADGPFGLFIAELVLLSKRWHIILLGLCFQYVHGIFTQLAYHMHQPGAGPLHDVGFELIPKLPVEYRWISEAIFTTMFVTFIVWSFTPLLAKRSFSTVVLWTRLLTVLVVCQTLRIITFSSTQLPGPAPHCHAGQLTAHIAPVHVWWQYLLVDVHRQAARSCGDLIFSSHMTFILTGVLAYTHYGSKRLLKGASWLGAGILAVLIIAARKHYTVDVVVAWYAVPMVYTLLHVYWHQCNTSSSNNSNSSTSCLQLYNVQSSRSSTAAFSDMNNCCSLFKAADISSKGGDTCSPVNIVVTVGDSRSSDDSPNNSSTTPSSPMQRFVARWFGRSPMRLSKQQLPGRYAQLGKADSGISADVEAQVLLPCRSPSGQEQAPSWTNAP